MMPQKTDTPSSAADLDGILKEADKDLLPVFSRFEQNERACTGKVLTAFKNARISDSHFAGSSGYGYSDPGRDALEAVYAGVFGAEAALVRPSIVSGTHALTIGLFGLLRPGDILLSATGRPYDTILPVIGLEGKKGDGSLADFGVEYRQVELRDGDLDLEGLRRALAADKEGRIKVVYLQRSKGYLSRKTLSVGQIAEAVKLTRSLSKARVMVDNCYGEFTSEKEPTAVGADLIAGSLIKNPGGGMAENGGYLAGTGEAVRLAGYRMTTVGVGGEGGATLGQNKAMIKGFFYAPHTVCQALKTAAFAAYLFGRLGMPVSPRWDEERSDIIQTVTPGSPEKLIAFCKGLQAGSPVDAFASPEPSPMPGYSDKVIMAAGAFTQGSSIELSADGPLRPPYTVFLQGGLTYESGRYGVISAAKAVLGLS